MLYVPADNPRIPLRAVISAEEANRLIDAIPAMDPKAFHSRSAQELSAHYQEALQSHDCAHLLELIRSIGAKREYLARQKRKCGRVDEHFMKCAKDSINGEFAVALGISGRRCRAIFPGESRPIPGPELNKAKPAAAAAGFCFRAIPEKVNHSCKRWTRVTSVP